MSPEASANRKARIAAEEEARKQRAELKAAKAADYDLARRIRLVIALPYLQMGGGGSGDVDSFTGGGIGCSVGLRSEGRFGVMIDSDYVVGDIGEHSTTIYGGFTFRRWALQVECYSPLGESGRRDEIVIGCHFVVHAELYDNSLGRNDTGWSDGSGFGFDLAYCRRVYRHLSTRLGLRYEWVRFGELKESGVSQSVSDVTDFFCVHASVEFRF